MRARVEEGARGGCWYLSLGHGAGSRGRVRCGQLSPPAPLPRCAFSASTAAGRSEPPRAGEEGAGCRGPGFATAEGAAPAAPRGPRTPAPSSPGTWGHRSTARARSRVDGSARAGQPRDWAADAARCQRPVPRSVPAALVPHQLEGGTPPALACPASNGTPGPQAREGVLGTSLSWSKQGGPSALSQGPAVGAARVPHPPGTLMGSFWRRLQLPLPLPGFPESLQPWARPRTLRFLGLPCPPANLPRGAGPGHSPKP